jgi:nucleotide-binding universal stress UspA family protein
MFRTAEPQPIVVAVDGSPHSDAAVEWAAHESALRKASVILVNVIAPTPDTPAHCHQSRADSVLKAAEARLRAVSGPADALDVRVAVLQSPVLPVLPALIDASARAQLIVVGSRGHTTLGRLLLGSVSTGLIHRAHCPVAVIPLSGHHRTARAHPRPVVVGVDGTVTSEEAIAMAFEEAACRHADLLAVHAWSDVGVLPLVGTNQWFEAEAKAKDVLAGRLAHWQEKYPDVHVTGHVVCDEPAHALTFEARCSQLVVVGNRGHTTHAGLQLGAVGSAVVHASPVPVIVVRGH